jgi:hypothetical protein
MNDLIVPSPQANQNPQTKAAKVNRYSWAWWHFVASIIWFYAVSKIFFFDIDIYVFHAVLPQWELVLEYKFVIFLAVVTAGCFVFSSKSVASFSIFVAFYPIIIFVMLLYYIIKHRSWMLLVAICNVLFVIFKSFRINALLLTTFFVSFAFILTFYDQMLLWPAMIALICLIYLFYISQIVIAFRAPSIIKIYEILFVDKSYEYVKFQITTQLKGISIVGMDDRQLTVYRNALQSVFLANKICLFAARILRDYKSSGFPILSGMMQVFVLFTLTVVTFSAVNFAAFKINIDSFEYLQTHFPSYFDFFHYSFNSMLLMSTRELTPVNELAYVINMLERVLDFLLVTVFVSQIISYRSKKFVQELDLVIAAIQSNSAEMEDYILGEFEIKSFDDAIAEIRKMESSLIDLILFLTKNAK